MSVSPVSETWDPHYSELNTDFDSLVYGISETSLLSLQSQSGYENQDCGWVDITTYVDNHGNLRVKRETLVAMSGITTGNIVYPTNEVRYDL